MLDAAYSPDRFRESLVNVDNLTDGTSVNNLRVRFCVSWEEVENEPYSYGGSRGWTTEYRAEIQAFFIGALTFLRSDFVAMFGEDQAGNVELAEADAIATEYLERV